MPRLGRRIRCVALFRGIMQLRPNRTGCDGSRPGTAGGAGWPLSGGKRAREKTNYLQETKKKKTKEEKKVEKRIRGEGQKEALVSPPFFIWLDPPSTRAAFRPGGN